MCCNLVTNYEFMFIFGDRFFSFQTHTWYKKPAPENRVDSSCRFLENVPSLWPNESSKRTFSCSDILYTLFDSRDQITILIRKATSSSMKSSGFCCVLASDRCDRDDINVFGTHPTRTWNTTVLSSVVHHVQAALSYDTASKTESSTHHLMTVSEVNLN